MPTRTIWAQGAYPAAAVYNPAGWGTNWRTARAASNSRLVNIVGFGHSIMQGYWSSNWRTKSWFGKLITDLQALYGDGGSGFEALSARNGAGPNIPVLSGVAGQNGGWDQVANSGGPNGQAVFPHQAGNGSFTVKWRGTTFKTYCQAQTNRTYTYNTDGAGAVAVTQGQPGTTEVVTATAVGATPNPHSTVVTAGAGSDGFPIFNGTSGQFATGIIGHNMGLVQRQVAGGTAFNDFANLGYLYNAGETLGKVSIQSFSPDLFILMCAVNDNASSIAAATWITNVDAACAYARAYSANCDIILLLEHLGSGPPANYPAYWTQLVSVATSRAALAINLWSAELDSYAFSANRGYFGKDNTGVSAFDPVHPSDLGHAAIEAVILPYLTA